MGFLGGGYVTLREHNFVSGLIKLYFSLQLTKQRLSQRANGISMESGEWVGTGHSYGHRVMKMFA